MSEELHGETEKEKTSRKTEKQKVEKRVTNSNYQANKIQPPAKIEREKKRKEKKTYIYIYNQRGYCQIKKQQIRKGKIVEVEIHLRGRHFWPGYACSLLQRGTRAGVPELILRGVNAKRGSRGCLETMKR